MGEALDRLRTAGYGYGDDTAALSAEDEGMVALAGFLSRVKSHKRTTASGEVVDVEAYTRTLKRMRSEDLYFALNQTSTNRAQKAQIVNELRTRGVNVRRSLIGNKIDTTPSGKTGMPFDAEATAEAVNRRGPEFDGGRHPRNATGQWTPPRKPTIGGVEERSGGGSSAALDKWYDAQTKQRGDDFGRGAAKSLTDEELDEAIAERERLNAEQKFGWSGGVDLDILKWERAGRGSSKDETAVEKLRALTLEQQTEILATMQPGTEQYRKTAALIAEARKRQGRR